MLYFQSIVITLSFIRSFAFKGCSWQPIPAHPQCPDWQSNGIIDVVSSRAFNRLQTMPQKPYKPPYAHLFQTIYVCRQDLSNNQTSLKKTESAVLISLPLFYHIFDQKQHNFDQFFQKIWKKFFCPKHSVFDGKLNGESIFFGPMVLKKFAFSENGLFHKDGKMSRFWNNTEMAKIKH